MSKNLERIDTSTSESAHDLPSLERAQSLTPSDLPELETSLIPDTPLEDDPSSPKLLEERYSSSPHLLPPHQEQAQPTKQKAPPTKQRAPPTKQRRSSFKDVFRRSQIRSVLKSPKKPSSKEATKSTDKPPARSTSKSMSFNRKFLAPKSPRMSFHSPIIKRQKIPLLEPFNRDRKNPRADSVSDLRDPPSLKLSKPNRRGSNSSPFPARCPQSPPPSSRPSPNRTVSFAQASSGFSNSSPHLLGNQPRRKFEAQPTQISSKSMTLPLSQSHQPPRHSKQPQRQEEEIHSSSKYPPRKKSEVDEPEEEDDDEVNEEDSADEPISSDSPPQDIIELSTGELSRDHAHTHKPRPPPASEPIYRERPIPPKIVVETPTGLREEPKMTSPLFVRAQTPEPAPSRHLTRFVSSPVHADQNNKPRPSHRRSQSMSFSRYAFAERSTSSVFELVAAGTDTTRSASASPNSSPRIRQSSPPFPAQSEIPSLLLGSPTSQSTPSEDSDESETSLPELSGEDKVTNLYNNAHVFVTGVTGFLGKVLLLRILEDLPKVEQIYVLARKSGEVNGPQRIVDMLHGHECFEKLRKQSDFEKLFAEKITVVEGDLTEEMLGISPSVLRHLTSKINYVIHCASSRDCSMPLETAMCVNVIGALRVMDLAKTCTDCKAFVYISAFNAFKSMHGIKPEQLDKIKFQPFDAVNTVKNRPNKVKSLEQDFLKSWSNTYVLTKVMAEHVLKTRSGATPLIIMRLPAIGAAYQSPEYGWSDTLTTTGTLATAIAGGLKVMLGRADCAVGMIPVDFCANAILTSIPYVLEARKTFVVFNLVSHTIEISSLEFLCETWLDYFRHNPLQFAAPVEVQLIPEKKQFAKVFEDTYKGSPRESIKIMRNMKASYGECYRTDYRLSSKNVQKLAAFVNAGTKGQIFPIDFPDHYQGDELADYLEAECRCAAVQYSKEMYDRVKEVYVKANQDPDTEKDQDPIWEELKAFFRQLDIEEKFAEAFWERKIRPSDMMGLTAEELKELVPDILPRSVLLQHIVIEKKSGSTTSSLQTDDLDLSPRTTSEAAGLIQRQYSTSKELPDPLFSSYAHKKSPSGIKSLRPWQKRFFRLFEDALLWCKKESSRRPLGILPLQSVQYVRANHLNRLDIIISGRMVQLRLETETIRDKWLDMFEQQRVRIDRDVGAVIVRPNMKLNWRKRRKSRQLEY